MSHCINKKTGEAKLHWQHEHLADRAAQIIVECGAYNNFTTEYLRSYKCPDCGFYHLTSRK